jgi:hypothetical protein
MKASENIPARKKSAEIRRQFNACSTGEIVIQRNEDFGVGHLHRIQDLIQLLFFKMNKPVVSQ